jgi:hypothetical protein
MISYLICGTVSDPISYGSLTILHKRWCGPTQWSAVQNPHPPAQDGAECKMLPKSALRSVMPMSLKRVDKKVSIEAANLSIRGIAFFAY